MLPRLVAGATLALAGATSAPDPRMLMREVELAVEHGHDQAAAVRALLVAAGFEAVGSRRDLAGLERITFGRLPA